MSILTCSTEISEGKFVSTAWQRELANAVGDIYELCRLAGLPISIAEAAKNAASTYQVMVPRPFLSRIRPGDANDPLLLQVLPTQAELNSAPGFTTDPLGETDAQCAPGLLWKYQNRILILTTPSCAVHCRFCFRRHFLLTDGQKSPPKPGKVADCIASNPSIHEIILSGGEPLILPNEVLSELIGSFASLPNIRRLRIHTRLPVLIPQRICNEFISSIKSAGLTVVIVVHINHPNEIDADVASALGQLVDSGIPVLSQGVLLAGINDNVEVLAELYERLIDLRIIPYYLHQLDAVAGAAHFEVPIKKGKSLIHQLRAKIPGYAVPRYVRETPGGNAKEILC